MRSWCAKWNALMSHDFGSCTGFTHTHSQWMRPCVIILFFFITLCGFFSDYHLHSLFFSVPLSFPVGMNGKSILSAMSRHASENSAGITPGSGATTSPCSSRSSSQRSGTGGHTPRGPHRSPGTQPKPPVGSSSSSSNALALCKTTNSPRLSPGQSREQPSSSPHFFTHVIQDEGMWGIAYEAILPDQNQALLTDICQNLHSL